MIPDKFHIPVLSHEAVDLLLNPEINQHVVVDGTLGGGGYTKLICEANETVKVIAIDKDLNALDHAKEKLRGFKDRITFVNGSFADVKQIIKDLNIEKISGIVLDLGLSSYQLEAEDGFSFMRETPLDMRAYRKGEVTAAEILNSYNKEELAGVFRDYGEIGNSMRLATAIVNKRKEKRFEMTTDLTSLVSSEYSISRKNMIDLLAKIFQALRIAVNDEIDNLEKVLNDSVNVTQEGGRIVIVSYHSLEDRMVKNFFREKAMKFRKTDNPYYDEAVDPALMILTKKPVVPGKEEIKFNSRSRSAKLRAAEIL